MSGYLREKVRSILENLGVLLSIQEEDLYERARRNPPESWMLDLTIVDVALKALVEKWKAQNEPGC